MCSYAKAIIVQDDLFRVGRRGRWILDRQESAPITGSILGVRLSGHEAQLTPPHNSELFGALGHRAIRLFDTSVGYLPAQK
jgi:hypothetical protein